MISRNLPATPSDARLTRGANSISHSPNVIKVVASLLMFILADGVSAFSYGKTDEPEGWRIAKFGDGHMLQTIIEKADGTPIGIMIFCDMKNYEAELQLKRIAILEKGRGYGKEALYLAQKYAFEVLGTKCLSLGTKEHNTRAQSIYKATGFTPDMSDPCTHFHIAAEDYSKRTGGQL